MSGTPFDAQRTEAWTSQSRCLSQAFEVNLNRLYGVHRWVGLLVVGQVSIWFFTGLVMSRLNIDHVHGDDTRAAPQRRSLDWSRVRPLPDEARSGAEEVVLRVLDGLPIYEVRGPEVALFSAESGQRIQVDEALATRLAQRDQKGEPAVERLERLDQSTLEYREKPVPAWAVHLADADRTTIYVDLRTARVTARRNDSWRLFDVLWGLHIMDYSERKNFSTFWLSAAAALALSVSLSGAAIWLTRARRYRRRGGETTDR